MPQWQARKNTVSCRGVILQSRDGERIAGHLAHSLLRSVLIIRSIVESEGMRVHHPEVGSSVVITKLSVSSGLCVCPLCFVRFSVLLLFSILGVRQYDQRQGSLEGAARAPFRLPPPRVVVGLTPGLTKQTKGFWHFYVVATGYVRRHRLQRTHAEVNRER